MEIIIDTWICSGCIPSPAEVSSKEGIDVFRQRGEAFLEKILFFSVVFSIVMLSYELRENQSWSLQIINEVWIRRQAVVNQNWMPRSKEFVIDGVGCDLKIIT